MAYLTVGIVIAAAFRVALPWPVKWIFDVAASPEGDTASHFAMAAGAIVLLAASTLYIGWKLRSTILKLIGEISERVRLSMMGYLQFSTEQVLGYHTEGASGFIRDIRGSTRALEQTTARVVLNSITIVLTAVVMLLVDWRLGLLTTLMLPLYWLPTKGMVDGVRKRAADRSSKRAPEDEAVIPYVVGATTRVVLAVGVATLLWLGAGMVMKGMLTPGQLLVFLAYLALARSPMIDLQEASTKLTEARRSRKEIDKVLLALGIEAPEKPGRRPPRFEGRVGFYDVTRMGESGGVDNLTLKFRPGRRTAFTGGSASSRRSLLRMLLRIDNPDTGKILIDGSDILEYDVTALRSQITAIPSEPIVMDATILEYVTDGEPRPDVTEAKAALAKVELLDWVEGLRSDIHTDLNGYIDQLTRSKRRQLALARAAYLKNPILLIDGPTVGLENDDKRDVMVALDRVSGRCTTLLVTDDLRVASRFDSIVFMEEGRVVEYGTHDELIDSEGPYAKLFQQTSPGPMLYATKAVQLTAVYEDRREPENINPFVFLVGCPGSGVSLIQQMLDGHQMVAVANDTHFIPSVLKDAGARGDVELTDDLVDRTRTFPNFDRLGLDNIEVYKAGGMSDTYAEFVTNLYNTFARNNDRELVAVKAPIYCRDIRLLHDLFPWARYIHVVRDGRDVAMSVLERATRLKEAIEATNVETVPIGASALWWKTMVETARRDGQRLGDRFYLEVRFEDLVQQPQMVSRQVGSFLELSNTRSFGEQMGSFATLDSVSNGFQDWRSQMARNDVALFEALAGETLEALDYGRGVSQIPEPVMEEAKRCLASWRNQKGVGPAPTEHRAVSNA